MKPSLVKKLVEVMACIDRIPKSGHNSFHNYDYTTEADVLEAVRGELAKRCVFIIPSVVDSKEQAVGDKGQRVFTLRMKLTAHDGETGESLSWEMFGQGSDSLDKGAFKAITGAMKYGLLKPFLVPTGDDPERDEPGKGSATPPPPAGTAGLKARMNPKPTPAGSRATHDRSLSFGFGNGKGKPISALDDKSLDWYANCLQRDLGDASKSKWHAKTAQQLATIQAEQRLRGDAQEDLHRDQPDEPPPPGDEDAPF
ncbi:MAG: ERF family protein [Archangiaceae bacterium]|nr:ERF family protein [Archangiaceae bacterium]